jgi:hypothetical protein
MLTFPNAGKDLKEGEFDSRGVLGSHRISLKFSRLLPITSDWDKRMWKAREPHTRNLATVHP